MGKFVLMDQLSHYRRMHHDVRLTHALCDFLEKRSLCKLVHKYKMYFVVVPENEYKKQRRQY
jgi:hypothetical protein